VTLREFVDSLEDLMERNPKMAEVEAITARDEEGNGYDPIYFNPTAGHYDRSTKDFDDESDDVNAVCVN